MELDVYKGEQTIIRSLIRSNLLPQILSQKVEQNGQLVEVGFIQFLKTTLNLKVRSEQEAQDLADRLGMVAYLLDEYCGLMTLEQVKKAILLYMMGKLPLQPRSNYFDGILFGQIIDAYKKSLPPKKQQPYELKLTEAELSANTEMNIKLCWKEWEETGRVKPGYAFYWDALKSAGLIQMPKRTAEEALDMAKRRHEEEKNLSPFDRIGTPSNPSKDYLRTVYKRIVMEEHFKRWKEEGETLLSKIEHKKAS